MVITPNYHYTLELFSWAFWIQILHPQSPSKSSLLKDETSIYPLDGRANYYLNNILSHIWLNNF